MATAGWDASYGGSATGSVLGGEVAAGTGKRSLGAGAGTVGGESADRSGQRVSGAFTDFPFCQIS